MSFANIAGGASLTQPTKNQKQKPRRSGVL